MPLAFITPRRNAALYLGNILLGSCIVWYGLPALGMPAPYWALISLIVIIEPDLALHFPASPRLLRGRGHGEGGLRPAARQDEAAPGGDRSPPAPDGDPLRDGPWHWGSRTRAGRARSRPAARARWP